MNNRDFINDNPQKDGCGARGTCSLAPSIAALQELLIYIIKQCSYYILELDALNLNNDKLIKDVINSLSSLVLINELNENNLYSLIVQNYYALDNAQKTYKETCETRNIPVNLLEFESGFNEKSSLAAAISEGEKLLKLKFRNISPVIREHIQILGIVIKSICSNLTRLYDLKVSDKDTTIVILRSVNILNNADISLSLILNQIKSIVKRDFELNLIIAKEITAHFGQISKVTVSHSSSVGKAILVSGNNFFDLLNILELAKVSNIDVYTHSDLLIAHALEKFSNYENLAGHYGNSTEDCIVDFATFPGAILITNNSKHNTEFLYRGKIFSNAYNIPLGVTNIINEDYSPLIQASLSSKGFSKGKIKPDSIVGFNEKEAVCYMEKIINMLANSEQEHIYVIICDSLSEVQKDYMTEFINNINNNEFVLSFSYPISLKNSLMLDLANFYPFIADFLSKVFKNKLTCNKITFMFNICNVTTLSGAIYLKSAGAKDVYFPNCSPRIVNPVVFEALTQRYNINLMTNPVDDITNMRNNNH